MSQDSSDKTLFTLAEEGVDQQASSGVPTKPESKPRKKVKTREGETVLDAERRRRKNRVVAFSLVGLSVVVALVFSLVWFNPFKGNEQKVFEGETYEQNLGRVELEDDADAAFYERKPFPVEVEGWRKNKATVDENGNLVVLGGQSAEELRAAILQDSSSSIVAAASVLPSEESGYTSDPEKETLEDGSLNPMYSYWTKEGFTTEVSIIVEALLNPRFGGWDTTASEGFHLGNMETMFSSKFLSQDFNASTVPVFADWNHNNYGMEGTLLDPPFSRWYGQVENADIVFNYDVDLGQYTATLTANVKFNAWTKDEKVATKTGTLVLNLVPNPNGVANPSSTNKVLVDSGSLVVQE